MPNTTMVDPFGRTDDERAVLRAKLEAVNAEARANWDNPVWRKEMAADLTETIYWGFQHENLLNLYTQVENVDFDGRSFVKEVRGLRAFWVARGGHIEASDMHSEVFEIPRDTLGFHVFEMEDKLRTGFGETQANLVNLGIQRMDAEVNKRVLAGFQAAVGTNSPYYITANGLSLSALNLALRQVRDVSLDFNVTILGRSTMTDQIIDGISGTGGNTAGFFPETNERLLEQGVIGVYRGARIVTLKNYRDDTDTPFFPANELWVIGRDASKFAFFGGLLSREYSEEDNWYWHYLARRDFGGVVYRPNRLRRIIDSSISATFGAGGTYTPVGSSEPGGFGVGGASPEG
jgi:hypothetical protein